jgi:hypothetical protein
MRIVELFSKRLDRTANSTRVDVYQYDKIPESVLYQIGLILMNVIGTYSVQNDYPFSESPENNSAWDFLIKTIAREHGNPSFLQGKNSLDSCLRILSSGRPLLDQLDLIELAFRYVDRVLSQRQEYLKVKHGADITAAEAIDELNYRLREGGVGYQFSGGQLTRIDSQFIHAEVVVEALRLLQRPGFEGPESEFRAAHAHYRTGSLREAVSSAGNAFESTMKSICTQMNWKHEKSDSSSRLLGVLKDNSLFPTFLDSSFDSMLAILKSGLPSIRNNSGSHGSGSKPLEVPQHVAAFAIHLAASKIVFLVECMMAK